MGTFSPVHWIIVLAAVFGTIYPVTKILSRAGLNRWWAILSVIPIVGWLGIWALAYARWPKVDVASA